MLGNPSNSTYHALQLQFTRRLTNGFTNTTAWTWSKALGDAETDTGVVYRDPTRRSIEKRLLNFDRAHQISSNGTYELPFGPGHRLLGNAPGWVQQVVNKWQLGGIMNFNTGAPLNLMTCTPNNTNTGCSTAATATGIYTIGYAPPGSQSAPGTPNVVGQLPKNVGEITKLSNG